MDAEKLAVLGFAIVVAGMLVMMFGLLRATEKMETGGVIVVGPFPIAFGSSRNITEAMMIVGAIMVLVFLILSLFLWRGFEFI